MACRKRREAYPSWGCLRTQTCCAIHAKRCHHHAKDIQLARRIRWGAGLDTSSFSAAIKKQNGPYEGQ
ncbi:hypothetical protein PR048_033760 [Dryococelus australis]|uniref:Uncharacterized protein n=1 Tax=Dryococelus australis TaxID=614101 RepID=A0ABQ9FZ27_9NEOP|nr:hypothetical protein PR048_033760 [Dryococelus australis]